ncbi:PGRC1 protein, partial [Hylia prasina]|nr:PGRC1 protein [Hylia prasina]
EADPLPLPKMKRRDFTLEQLRPFDGVSDPRILMAVNGKVFDVTRARKFYGPGEGGGGRGTAHSARCARDHRPGGARGRSGPVLARSAFPQRGSALLPDPIPAQVPMRRKITWDFFFPTVKYHHVGKLLKEGEEPTVYSDEDEKDAQDAKKE